MTQALVKPEKLTKENEDRLVSMLKDICGPMLSDLVKEQMATFREDEAEKPTGGIPDWIKQLAAKPPVPEVPETSGTVGVKMNPGSGDLVSRLVTAIAAGKHQPRHGADGWYKDRYGEDDVFKALAATDSVAGGFLVPDAQAMEIIELLRPASVVRQMNPVIEPMMEGKLSIPGLATGSAATYIGENANMTQTEPTFRQIDLIAKKLAALVPISNDLIRRRQGASTMVRDDLINAIAEKSDSAFIRSDGTAGEPKGLRYRANSANITTVTASVVTENVLGDLGNAMLGLMNNDVRMIRPAWLMAPRTMVALMVMTDANGNAFLRPEMSNGRLFGYPFGVTNNIPINLAVTATDESELYFVDFADVVIGESTTLILDASTEAAYYDGSSVQAAFSLDQTVIRAVVEHDLQLRHDFSVYVYTDVDWTPGITT